MKVKKYDDDDGRQIVDMSSTYDFTYTTGMFGIRKRSKKTRKVTETTERVAVNQPPLTKRETRKLMVNALLGGLAIGFVFVIVALIFILFCVFVWFK